MSVPMRRTCVPARHQLGYRWTVASICATQRHPEPMHGINNRRGFVLPIVLGIILIAALIAVHSATELDSTTVLATQRLLHQRAFEAGESGLIAALDQLRSGAELPSRQILQSADAPTDTAQVDVATTAQIALPSGYSVGRVRETLYDIRSSGHSARAANVTVVQGVRQLQAVTSP
jgi:Tfp pilus assembly protein PilX